MNRKKYKIIYKDSELFKNQFAREMENLHGRKVPIAYDLVYMIATCENQDYFIINNFARD